VMSVPQVPVRSERIEDTVHVIVYVAVRIRARE